MKSKQRTIKLYTDSKQPLEAVTGNLYPCCL